MRLFDAHAHLAPGKAEALLAAMDRAGIARAVVVAGGVVPPATLGRLIEEGGALDVDVDNQAVLEACRASERRLVPFYFANPWRGAADYARDGAAFAGLKLGPVIHGVPFADPWMHALLAQAAMFGHPAYLHCLGRAGFRVQDFVVLAAAFPQVRFILGHAGIGNCDFGAVERIAPLANVSFEMSGGFRAVCRAAVDVLGAGRVLFGSEYPLQDPRIEIAKLDTLELSVEERTLVGFRNIERLLAPPAKGNASCAA